MRIDLPCGGFKSCHFQADGNCTKRNEYARCEFQEYKKGFYELVEYIREIGSCFGCKYAIDGAECLCEDCDVDEETAMKNVHGGKPVRPMRAWKQLEAIGSHR